ncbi:serine/threonine-protein kinase CTR1-like [Cucurbita moschata]|uniref:non-specific serine/threonine protein kinase n=1 Tax=Cucurbita moschata TaxID=3662 RepID=A0A6J1F8L1_CUCMO|nr:serine/threonine-protein kinase CTR1-like [Cucurbita moschata]
MEMPGRRLNYTLLSQIPDDQYSGGVAVAGAGASTSLIETSSGEGKNDRRKLERGLDWEAGGDHRSGQQQQVNWIGNMYSTFGLQRQSSGSSFGESSISGEYYAPTPSTTVANETDAFGCTHDDVLRIGGDSRPQTAEMAAGTGGSSSKSWAQQTEESYQLQLALALRLSSVATCAEDPNFLNPFQDDSVLRRSISSAEAVSHRFWVNGCLSYFDKVPDGFYLIRGMDPYVWTVCTSLPDNDRMPSIESLKSVDPSTDSSIEVVLIDRRTDPNLKDLQNWVQSVSCTSITTEEVVDQLAKLVCRSLGGSVSGEDVLESIWRECSDNLKETLGSVVVPLGGLSVGLCRHRALLFKVLADTIDLPCRVAKGCKYCSRHDSSSCLVQFGLDKEYLVDLIGNPGCLYEPDSLLNGPSSILISSPLRLPRLKPVEPAIDFRSLAKQYFSDCQLLNVVFDEASSCNYSENTVDGEDSALPLYLKQFDRKFTNRSNQMLVPGENDEKSILLHAKTSQPNSQDRDFQLLKLRDNSHNAIQPTILVEDSIPLKYVPHISRGSAQSYLDMSHPRMDSTMDVRFQQGGQLIPGTRSNTLPLGAEDLDIPWNDLVLKERIGAGSFGTVHRADWHGSEVAVKILTEQDFHPERVNEFLREVAIMKSLRHPNIVLFMGAVTKPPNLSIVTEYLSRGSLYRLLHKSGVKDIDETRRINMAFDVAKGMNYLHRRDPPIVHRDLKSPNLLVDRKYTVKVCDFGLSRLKARTFLSSKSAAGTPEWMAPEVLRDEPSNEKSDVYSFGVILWELATLQQPWCNLNPAQVVAAVGFKGLRLEIPRDVNPKLASLIMACWADEPWKRPSFSSIMETLKPMTKQAPPQQGRADTLSVM